MRRSFSNRCKVVAFVVLGSLGRAQAAYQWDGLRPLAVGGTFMGGSTVLVSGVGSTGSTTGGSTTVMAVAGILAALSGVTATSYFSKLGKELVVQLKVDHDTYLAGGERTPLLEEVYRELILQTKEYSVRDPRSGRERMDEQKLTDAIDRLVLMVETSRVRP